MSCLLITLQNLNDLQLVDKYISQQSEDKKISICFNNPYHSLDIHDAAIKYLVDRDIQGEIVNISKNKELLNYVKSSDLQMYNTEKFIEYNNEEGLDQKIILADFKNTDYFAQGEKYKNEKNNMEAIECYKKVLYDKKYDDQYKYLACLYMGQLSKENTDRIKYFLLGISYDHERVECYYELVILENCRGNNVKAAFYGSLCPIQNIDVPREPDLKKPQINILLYKYLFDLNFGVACFYANLKQDGYYATLRALKGASDENQRKVAIANLKYYNEIRKEMPYKPELLVIDNFYSDPYKLVKQIFATDKQTKEYNNIELLVNDHSHFIIKPKIDLSSAKNILNKVFKTVDSNSIGEFCSSSGLINLKGGYMSNWVNYTNKHSWNVVVFLQPSSQGSSLELLSHIPSKAKEIPAKADVNTLTLIERDVYDSSCWNVTEKIEERFNRCVIYYGNRFYQFTKYYNSATLDSYMMYQSFCFDI